eukprot:1395284-Alexandrium_andersonii.AAC.1
MKATGGSATSAVAGSLGKWHATAAIFSQRPSPRRPCGVSFQKPMQVQGPKRSCSSASTEGRLRAPSARGVCVELPP